MNRIDSKFSELKKMKKKAFIAFITAGDPSLKITERLVLAFEKAGVDIIELGVPFSDPLADGPTIQASSQKALEHGATLDKIFQLVKRLRKKTEIPIALMMYYNPIFHYGEDRFVEKAIHSGVDGVIVPDLPPEEATGLIRKAKGKNLATVFFLSPTTTHHRMKQIVKASSGFIYYVSLTGVTGARKQLTSTFKNHIKKAKQITKKPICVGFGISSQAHVKSVVKIADGVIVGSAIINNIDKYRKEKRLVSKVTHFVQHLVRGL